MQERLEAGLCRHLGFDEHSGGNPVRSREDLDAASAVWCERLARGEFGWEVTTISVDETPVEFSVLEAANRWVAVADLSEIVLVLEADRFPIERVTLVHVTDLSAYGVNGSW